MPETLAGYPFYALSFDRDAKPVAPHDADALRQRLADDPPAHLVVLAHGWKNDTEDASGLYERLMANVRAQDGTLDLVVAGVFWPSKKFADRDLIPGGAASVGGDVPVAVLEAALKEAELDATEEEAEHLRGARVLVSILGDSEVAQDRFMEHLRALLPDEDAGSPLDDGQPKKLREAPGHEVLAQLEAPPAPAPAAVGSGGGAAGMTDGGAAGIGSAFRGIRTAARNALNLTTYYQMKHRAGLIGEALADVLDDLSDAAPGVSVHLVGHSFGGRLATAACAATDRARPASLTLLQAAFSHNGFGQRFDGVRDGGYRTVVAEGRVHGPIVITHTRNDKAVGSAYPLASRLAGQAASAFGDADDTFGGMGSNGAQHTPEAVGGTLGTVDYAYLFRRGAVYNLLADAHVRDHSDVTNPQVAAMLRHAMAAAH